MIYALAVIVIVLRLGVAIYFKRPVEWKITGSPLVKEEAFLENVFTMEVRNRSSADVMFDVHIDQENHGQANEAFAHVLVACDLCGKTLKPDEKETGMLTIRFPKDWTHTSVTMAGELANPVTLTLSR